MHLTDMELVLRTSSGLEIDPPCDDVTGMTVVDPTGLRLGEVDDVVIDVGERRARLISVVSGGILDLDRRRTILPVEVVTRVDDRIRVDRSCAEVHALLLRQAEAEPAGERPPDADGRAPFAAAYDAYGIVPCWSTAPADTGARATAGVFAAHAAAPLVEEGDAR